jgi:asparagine synthetase B (glutamine-hydrolysing)
MLNGPFAIILGFNGGMVALNDRIKLRPLVAARSGSVVVVASEEAAIRAVAPSPDAVWMPKAGEPTVARIEGMPWPIHGDLHLSPSEVSCAVLGTEDVCDEAVEVTA